LIDNNAAAGMEGEGGDEVQGHNELRLRHALDPRTRRWARAEFFCSALDRPWLANNGVQQLCNHFGLKKGQLARLSRTEWTCIRRSLGRPRRLSLAFLRQVYSHAYTPMPIHPCLAPYSSDSHGHAQHEPYPNYPSRRGLLKHKPGDSSKAWMGLPHLHS